MIRQRQTGGDASTNIQAQSVTVNQGLTVSDVKAIAEDLFKANFLELSDLAADVAETRAREITEAFLHRLESDHAPGLRQAEDPDFQYALYTAQKEYARSGDPALGDLLVDLLVDRAKQDGRSILQIVLNESLSVAPKLTADQLAALGIIFLLRYSKYSGMTSAEALGTYLDQFVQPHVAALSPKMACYQHLAYSGCGTISTGSYNLVSTFTRYRGIFSRGFSLDLLAERAILVQQTSPMFVPNIRDSTQWQLSAETEEELRLQFLNFGVSEDDAKKLLELSGEHAMTADEVREAVISIRPYMRDVFDIWEGSAMKRLTLTSVGIAIGHANIKKSVGAFTDLAIWIN